MHIGEDGPEFISFFQNKPRSSDGYAGGEATEQEHNRTAVSTLIVRLELMNDMNSVSELLRGHLGYVGGQCPGSYHTPQA